MARVCQADELRLDSWRTPWPVALVLEHLRAAPKRLPANHTSAARLPGVAGMEEGQAIFFSPTRWRF